MTWTVAASVVVLAVLGVGGLVVERGAARPAPEVGQPAPDFRIPATSGGGVELRALRGRAVVLLFMPSTHCGPCREQLSAGQAALPQVQAARGVLLAVSVDPLPAGRAVAAGLGLTYPLLSEAPTAGLHPASSAYGIYHAPQPDAGPVDAFAAFVIDREGVIRWRRISPGRPVPMADVVGALREVAP